MANINLFPVVQQGFDRVGVGILGGDGVDAAGVPTVDHTDWSLGLGTAGISILLPATQYGQRITGINAAVDQGIDYPRGLRCLVLATPGANDPSSLIGAVATWPGYVACYAPEATSVDFPNLSSGAIVPDVTTMAQNELLGLILGLSSPKSQPYQVLADEIQHTGNTKFGANNGTRPLIYSMDGRMRNTWDPGLWIPPKTAALVVIASYRAYSGSLPAALTKLVAATIRGSVHGYALDQPATTDVAFTPSRFGNQAVPGSL